MSIALVTGSCGLIGAQTVRSFSQQGMDIIGIDNDMRSYFFGEASTTTPTRDALQRQLNNYTHYNLDIRDLEGLRAIFKQYGSDISVIIHTAAQPSHDWAVREPFTDFSINATATLNLLELTRQYCAQAAFIFTSTNKVYGDRPNSLPLQEKETRWEIDGTHPYFSHGIDEKMSIDASKHSLFGASKVSADILVQEYGQYFGMNTVCFRGGCLTGPQHAGAELHGFLSYLAKCIVTGDHYSIFGYKGKQVRDNIHSKDLVSAFWEYYKSPRSAEIYNIGGGRYSNCSMLEAIEICENLTGKKANITYQDDNRIGDHIWWISDTRKFKQHYSNWQQHYDIHAILEEIVTTWKRKLSA